MDYEFAKDKRHGLCIVKGCRRNACKNNRLCSTHKMRKWREENPFKAAYANLRCNARKRKCPFLLTFDEFVQFCMDTGYMDGKGNRSADDLHIDRIIADHPDGTRGAYAIGNIQVLTNSENSYKSQWERDFQKAKGTASLPLNDDEGDPF